MCEKSEFLKFIIFGLDRSGALFQIETGSWPLIHAQICGAAWQFKNPS
jgi:hypothetical protein